MSGTLFSGESDLVLHDRGYGFLRIEQAILDSVAIGRVTSTGHDVALQEHDSFTILVPLAGTILSEVGRGEYRAPRGDALFFSPNRRRTRVEPRRAGRFVAVPLLIPRKELNRRAEMQSISPRRLAALGDIALEIRGEPANRLAMLCRSIIDDLDARAQGARAERPDEDWADALLDWAVEALSELQGIELPPLAEAASAERHVRSAEDFMRENVATISQIAEIARACGISTRTLEDAFRRVRHRTPVRVLNDLRLEEARRLLNSAAGPDTVTEAALCCGITHFGRFAQSYRRLYGEKPSETLKARVSPCGGAGRPARRKPEA